MAGNGDVLNETLSVNKNSVSYSTHACKLLRALNESRKDPSSCDGIMIFRDGRVPIQRSVLAAACPYFRLLYAYSQEDTGSAIAQRAAEVEVKELSCCTFEHILDYIYTAEIELNVENVQDILQAADIFLIEELKQICGDFLEQNINLQNCIGIWAFTEQFSCPWTHHVAEQFIHMNFSQVWHGEEFLTLTFEQLAQLLKRDTLAVSTEQEVWNATLQWVKHMDERQTHLEELMATCLRLCHLCPSMVLSEPLVKLTNKNAAFKELFIKWEHMKIQKTEVNRSLNRGQGKQVFIVAGGSAEPYRKMKSQESVNRMNQLLSSVYCLKPAHPCRNEGAAWIPLADMLHPRFGHSVIQAGKYMYAVGGMTHGNDMAHVPLLAVERYDPTENKWIEVASVKHPRVRCGLVSIKEELFVLGGEFPHSGDPVPYIEVLNIFKNTWQEVGLIAVPRSGAAYAVTNENILMIGGFSNGKFYESVERYEPRSDSWSPMPALKERRCNAHAVTAPGSGSSVYVIGGWRPHCPSTTHQCHMKLCDIEVLSSDGWQKMDSRSQMCLMQKSDVFGMAMLGDRLVVAGKLNLGHGNHYLRMYHQPSATWHSLMVAPPIPQPMHAAVCSLQVPNTLLNL
ncbi:PREDICTED: gigaxonin-like [Priapulus caudatus]|uniref:Gigaxonin-like n=1 Tax=Priapulus caudatus TaxID=37621 RepID=A0ABM1EDU4_PRICU|nr:PREDICTED: gigaxonin-like [Priapulus caudatus]